MSMQHGKRWMQAAVAAGLAAALAASVAHAMEPQSHRIGFTPYARVDRPDGTHRTMLVDDESLQALRNGRTPDDAMILMESFPGNG